tara:strand:- start:41 stop:2344 length:2304 start_codon:yes stop_codon:yes gene_type:complete
MVVVGSGELSSLGTVGTTQLTDKVDSPHTGLFKALHNMTQGNVALDFGGTDASGNFGFSHVYTYVDGAPRVTVQGGLILFEGKKVAVADSSALTLTKPSSGAFYHWITVNSGGTIGKTLGTTDGVVPEIPVQTVPISLIKVQSTDSSGDLATQFYTTTKQSNSLSIGYDNSEEYTEVSSFTGTASGLFISNIGTATVAADDKVIIQDTGSSDVIKTVRVDSLGALSGAAVLTGSTNNTITTVTAANAITGEANLTFNATTLAVTGNQTITPANDVGAAALTITNADTDQIALDIAASNVDGDVINIVSNALTTAKVIDISATGLTDGMLFNAATTSTVTDGGTSTLISTALTNDGVGSQTAKGLLLDYNKTGITASGKTVNLTGMHIDIDDSVTNVGTVNVTGLDIDCNFGNTGGAVKNIGLDVAVAGADNNYAALFSGGFVGMGTTTPVSLLHLKTSAAFDPTTSTVASMYNSLLIDGSAASSGDGNFGGAIAFTGVGSGRRRAAIAAVQTTSDSDEVGLSFFTHDAASPSTNEVLIEQMRITDAGRIGIGTITPMNILQINHTGIDTNNGMLIIRADTSTADGDLLGGIGFDSTDGNVPSAVTEASAFITSYATEDHATTDKGGNLKFGVSLIDEDDDVVSTVVANVGPPDTTANATCYAGLNSRATTAIIAAATYAPTVTDSGTLVVFEHANSNLTLPSVNNTASVGVQFTVFNETGSAIESQIATSDSATINGASAGAPNDDIASYKAATFVCSGNNTWIRIG